MSNTFLTRSLGPKTTMDHRQAHNSSLFYYRTKLENILLSDNNEHNVRCAYDELCYWPDPWQLGRDKRKKMFIRNIKHFWVLINLDRDT